MANRRTFVAGLLATGLLPKPTWADAGDPAYLSAGRKPDGSHVLCGLNRQGSITFECLLPARGHAAAAHPSAPEAVAFARRPGTFAIVLDCINGQTKARLEAPAGRHFYGHGVYSEDGALLFTTENDFDNALGVVGAWDTRRGYRRLGEFWSGGIGPHDIKLMPDGRTLVVANGGIETHPATGRTKLNIPTMRPNMSYLGLDGAVKEQVELDEAYRKNSIRHLAVSNKSQVAFAMQWQGDLSDHPPLVGLHRRGEQARLTKMGNANRAMAGYVGSIAISDTQRTVAATSPRGGVMQVFDLDDRRLRDQVAIEDVCGIAETPGGYFVTSGLGQAFTIGPTADSASESHIKWDNHLIPANKDH